VISVSNDVGSASSAAESTPASAMKRRKLWIALGVIAAIVAVGALFTWYKFFREEPQPDWIRNDPEMRFKYGSIGAERDAGIPYWIFYVLPRVFPDKIPGSNGFASFGVSWEQGQELPVGFTKKVVGFARVANNCAACHTANYRLNENEVPRFYTAAPGHTLNLEGVFRFLVDCAKDPRFDADTLMREINLVPDLSFIDSMIYRFVLIPITKKRLVEREAQFAWIYRHDFPEWGPGRDDAMNLTKYFMIEVPMDDSIGPTDIPPIWNLKKYEREAATLNWAGDSHDTYSVIIDSALGLLGAAPKNNEEFLGEVEWLQDYLSAKAPPPYPLPIDAAKSAAGAGVFARECASCHASEITGTRLPLKGVDTDAERLWTWKKEHAVAANKAVQGFGIDRKGLVEDELIGYNAVYLDGLWLRAPYLHNGSVPTLRDLLNPPAERPAIFWRGYDLFDDQDVGFISTGAEAERVGTPFDTSQRSNGNGGHLFGTMLPTTEKDALIEYLKTL
jgi:mono/diheme cytochrome c family protein